MGMKERQREQFRAKVEAEAAAKRLEKLIARQSRRPRRTYLERWAQFQDDMNGAPTSSDDY